MQIEPPAADAVQHTDACNKRMEMQDLHGGNKMRIRMRGYFNDELLAC
jgi:hypothetical protein